MAVDTSIFYKTIFKNLQAKQQFLSLINRKSNLEDGDRCCFLRYGIYMTFIDSAAFQIL